MTINDVNTYEDDFGNTKQLTTVDHSPKTKFYGSKKESLKELRDSINQHKEDKKTFILSLSQTQLKPLLKHFGHILLWDDEKDILLWDNLKINELFKDDVTFSAIYNLIQNINDSNN